MKGRMIRRADPNNFYCRLTSLVVICEYFLEKMVSNPKQHPVVNAHLHIGISDYGVVIKTKCQTDENIRGHTVILSQSKPVADEDLARRSYLDMAASKNEDISESLSKLQITKPPAAPVLDDLMKWHVYVGYSWEDREPVKELHAILQSKGLTCSVRSGLDVKEEAQTDNIKQGIIFSHKCLLYISSDYLADPKSQQEFKEAERKLKMLGKNSVYGIVKYKTEPLGEYEQFQLIFLKDGQTLQDCLTNFPNWNDILKDYELNTQLSLAPKENIGVGVAYTYFFSFLQMVVPGVWNSVVKEMQNLLAVKERAENKFLVKKLLILIPKTLQSPLKLTDDTNNFRKANHSIKQCFHRAGKENREYTIPIYELTDKSGNVYYFVTDIPSCLYAIREAYDCDLKIMSQDEINVTRNDFVLTLKALLNHPYNLAHFENQWELLLWPEIDDENKPMKLSEFVSQQIKSKDLAVRFADVPLQPIDTKSTPDSSDAKSVKRPPGYTSGISAYPMYTERPRYVLKNFNRGYCVIISNFRYLKGNLGNRKCANVEIEKLEELFKALKFEVVTERNLDVQLMLSVLKEYRDKDHSKSDAFVCCLLSHGSKGRIFGSDGKEISVVKLMEPFYEENCPGLRGKPKLFFIGSCQSRASTAEDQEPGTTLQSTSAEPMSTGAEPGLSSESSDIRTDSHPEGISANVMRDLIPSAVDFIVSYACLPYTAAIRNEVKGGYYVQALCRHLNRDLEIDVALRNVNQAVRDLWDEDEKEGSKVFKRPDPFHIIMPPQKFLFLNSNSENKQ